MNAITTMNDAIAHAPTAEHIGDADLPWVSSHRMDGVEIKVVTAKVKEGIWIVRNRFAPGVELQPHKHTGPSPRLHLVRRLGIPRIGIPEYSWFVSLRASGLHSHAVRTREQH